MRLERVAARERVASPRTASRIRWAKLAGRRQGESDDGDAPFVLLHGLTFDRRMWDPVLAAFPNSQRAIAFDLPGHGGSRPLARGGLDVVVDAIHDAVIEAGLERPVMVGHSIGGPLAAIYASRYPAAAVVSVEAPIRLEPFARLLREVGPHLQGDDFELAWSGFRRSWRLELVPAEHRELLRASEVASRDVVLSYQADLLERPLADVLRWRDEGLRALREAGTRYVSLHANPVDPSDRAFLGERLPHAELVVWPVEHHFPHLADPARFAALLTGVAAGLGGRR